jgi:hypothetical protein
VEFRDALSGHLVCAAYRASLFTGKYTTLTGMVINELRWKLNPQVFSHGWELPARHWSSSGSSGEGIPADARYKPGSGGPDYTGSGDLLVTGEATNSVPFGGDTLF